MRGVSPGRNLGLAILLAAIADYRCATPKLHDGAEAFLYPRTAEDRAQFEWVMGMLPSVNAAWLRQSLDCYRIKWDGQRRQKILRRQRTNAA